MASPSARRPRSAIEGMSSSNLFSTEGDWVTVEYKRFTWVTMQPSMQGAHKVPRRHIASRVHHWKGRILELKQGKDGKRMAKVQHVYTPTQLKLEDNNARRFSANYIFPSDCIEWQPLESFTGTFEGIHAGFGELLYAGFTGSQLASRQIFFFDATYVLPRRGGWGKLVPIQAPTLASIEWPLPDNSTLVAFKRRIEVDVQAAMKCTYGSHKATIGLFIPLHIFVFMFHCAEAHRTPTMWISKGERALSSFLAEGWDTKVVQHQGDSIKCSVIGEKIICRYYIAKQTLSVVFAYRRWKLTRSVWEPLDSDIVCREQVEVQVSVQEGEVHQINVNDDWHLENVREYLAQRFSLTDNFTFVMGTHTVRRRREKLVFCKDLIIPRNISLWHGPNM